MQKVTIIIIITIAIVLFTVAVTAQERPPIDGNGSHSNVTIAPPPIVTRYAPTMTPTPTALPTEQWYPTPDNDIKDCPCSNVTTVPPIYTNIPIPIMTVIPAILPTEQWYPTPDDAHNCPRCGVMRFVNWRTEHDAMWYNGNQTDNK